MRPTNYGSAAVLAACRYRTPVAGLAAAALFVAVAWPGLRENSATYDETLYLPAGYAHLTRGDLRLGPEAPWLLKSLFALPVLSLEPVVSPEAERAFEAAAHNIDAQWVFGDRFLYRDNRPHELLFRARLVSLALAAALVMLVHAWARELFGSAGALFAATLIALDPNFLAHGVLATADVGATLFFAGTIFFARRALRVLTARDAAVVAIMGAASFATKFTATLLVPVLGVFCGVRLARSQPWPLSGHRVVSTARGRAAVVGALLLLWSLTAVGSLWAVYGSGDPGAPNPGFSVPLAEQLRNIRVMRLYGELGDRGTSMLDAEAFQRMVDRIAPSLTERVIAACARWRLVPEQYLSGLAFATGKAQARYSFLLGGFSLTGSRAYFPVAFAVKTPTAALVVVAASLLLLFDARSSLRRNAEAIWLLAPAGIIALAAVGSRLNIGHRHILPLYPFLYILAGSLPGEVRRLLGQRAALLTTGTLVLALATETLAVRPYFLSFFNLPAGGSISGLELLSDSNLDWGQGLPALRRWMDEQHIERVNLCYFGSADPAAYGIRFVPLPGSYHADIPGAGTVGYEAQPPELPGWVAISATNLQGTYLSQDLRDAYAFLRRKRPAAMLAGGAIYVYWVERWGE
jgi:hypothetical protein